MLILGNAIAVAIALHQQWPMAMLLLPFWFQSVVIGFFTVGRILSLRRFSTENFAIRDKQPAETPRTQWYTAAIFTVHYGIFLFVYMLFVATLVSSANQSAPGGPKLLTREDWIYLGVTAAVFIALHTQTFFQHRAADRLGCPNIGTLMFLPYARIVPMQMMIIIGTLLGRAGLAVVLFGALKTAADVLMHVVQQRSLAPSEPR